MTQYRAMRLLAASLFALYCLACAGCSTRSNAEFVPAVGRARDALTQALSAWQNGKPPHIKDADPPVEALDSRWKKGAKLASFEILETEPGAGPSWFKVKLTLKEPAAEKTVRYIVIGNDPLWVYSEEEYKAVTGM